MSDPTPTPSGTAPGPDAAAAGGAGAETGTLLRARNGDVIGYDATGLVMRLSDRVIADIARRIGLLPAAPGPAGAGVAGSPVAAPVADPGPIADVDAWNLRQTGEWYVFSANLPGEQGPARQYRCLVDTGTAEEEAHIVADAPGALLGVLAIGGPRAAHALPRRARFPYHLLAPADDIGAVGMGGVEPARAMSHLHGLREVTREALMAEVLLEERLVNHRAMPLYLARVETDGSASVAALREGLAFRNLMQAAESLRASAERLAKPARALCVRIDYALEDLHSDAAGYRDGMLALMEAITEGLAALGFHKPVFLAGFDCGTAEVSDHPALRGQSELAWNHGGHDLVFSQAGYACRQDRYARPTAAAMARMARMDALAVTAIYEDRPWFCPTFLLAEREPGDRAIRVRARAMTDLVVDAGDPFGAGPAAGFRLEGATGGAGIVSVARCPADPQDLILTLDRAVPPAGGAELRLVYALGQPPRGEEPGEGYPAARGAVRDAWREEVADDAPLHRWALPCDLAVH